VAIALLAAAAVSSCVIAASSAAVTPVSHARTGAALAISPVPVGTKVHTASAKSVRATATLGRSNSRGGHALTVKARGTRLYKGIGTIPGRSSGHDHVVLAPPAAPTATAGTGMPIIGSGQPPIAAAPLTPGANKLSAVDMRVLVISADGNETDLGAIKADLESVGVPYTVMIANQTQLAYWMLWDGNGHGYYQGVILTTNSLTYSPDGGTTWQSAFTDADWQTLWTYESSFNVRQVTSYTAAFGWPETLGLSVPVATIDTTSTPMTGTLTTAGKAVWSYLNPSINLTIGNAWVYESTITDPATTTPLITANGYPIASVHTSADGRQNLAITAANAYYLRHSQVLGYGIVNWVTKGVFLGKKRISMTPQPDDLFIDNDQWDVTTDTDTTGTIYRNTSTDWQALINWQAGVRASSPLFSAVNLEFPFNGEGTTGIYTPDTLSSYVYSHQGNFAFISHTWSHQNLDYANNESGTPTTAAMINSELTQNDTFANKTGVKLSPYFKDAMVQPDISGLNTAVSGLNDDLAQQTAYAWGIRYWISDTSRAGWNNPSPNVGFWASAAPGLLIIPRHPTNIFYNVSTPDQVVDEYNFFYAPGGRWAFWPSPRTYAQIIDTESDNLLAYLIQGDNDPWMFHSSNWRAYDGVHSVLGDLLSATLTKYKALYNLPIQGNTEHQLGLNMTQWMAYKVSGAQAILNPCSSIQITATKAATVPVTGVASKGSESYGGQSTSYVAVSPNHTVVLPVPTTPC
jgi:hypothetical protein